jgi:hypothetical protein
MPHSYNIRKYVYANSDSVFGERTALISLASNEWIVCSSKPLFELTEDLNLFLGIDHRKQFREHYGINEGYSIEYISSAGNSYYVNYPENPHGYDRMSFMIHSEMYAVSDLSLEMFFASDEVIDIPSHPILDVKLTLYPIHDIIATHT